MGCAEKVVINNNCGYCYGFGQWPGEDGVPVTEEEAREGFSTEPCFACGSDNWFFEGIMCDTDEYEPDQFSLNEKFLEMIKKFRESVECAESLELHAKKEKEEELPQLS